MTPEQWATIRFFRPNEFDSPDAPDSGKEMQFAFIQLLDTARAYASIPFFINSGIRTPAHNAEVGGVDSSAHENGWAADILVAGRTSGSTSRSRWRVVSAAFAAGITRIGIGRTFVHLDTDPSKPQNVIWLYD